MASLHWMTPMEDKRKIMWYFYKPKTNTLDHDLRAHISEFLKYIFQWIAEYDNHDDWYQMAIHYYIIIGIFFSFLKPDNINWECSYFYSKFIYLSILSLVHVMVYWYIGTNALPDPLMTHDIYTHTYIYIFYHDVGEIWWPQPIRLLKMGHVTGQGSTTTTWVGRVSDLGKSSFHKMCKKK